MQASPDGSFGHEGKSAQICRGHEVIGVTATGKMRFQRCTDMGFNDYKKMPRWVRVLRFLAWCLGLFALSLLLMVVLADL